MSRFRRKFSILAVFTLYINLALFGSAYSASLWYSGTGEDLLDGALLDGSETISVQPDTGDPDIRSVSFRIDRKQRQSDRKPPFEWSDALSSLGEGSHRVDAKVKFENGTSKKLRASIVISSVNPPPPPGELSFSLEHGFFEKPFDLSLTTELPGALIRYTTDGSAPSATKGTVYGKPIPIKTTTVVRAVAISNDKAATDVKTQSYIFPKDVVRQGKKHAGYPSSWGKAVKSGFVAGDYEMDPKVLAAHPNMANDLMEIPTMSIAMDPGHLFSSKSGAKGGIYYGANSLYWGRDSERPGSVELIHPDGSEGFQEGCGIKIAGAASREKRHTIKHSFTLKFREEYGDVKLRHALFPHSNADKFDTVRLRAGMNDAYSNNSLSSVAHASYLRDQWARDTQRDMGWTAADGIFVHLYINGLYWGLYNPSERPDASFMAQRIGGDKDHYDVISNARRNSHKPLDKSNPRISDGNIKAWNDLLDIPNWGKSQNYAKVKQLLDINQHIDYMIIEIYAANIDFSTPTRSADSRNWRAGRKSRNRDEKDVQFQFFIWDVENAMGANRDAKDYTDDISSTGGIFDIHRRLLGSAEYRKSFSERVKKHFFGNGALTPKAAAARFTKRLKELGSAVIPETARWGDQLGSPSYTYEKHWRKEIDYLLDNYFPNRTEEVLQQFKAQGLY